MPSEASSLSDQLPLFQLKDFDALLNQGVPIGIDSSYPSELRVRLSAASISYQMGNKSIDHVIKHYFKDFSYEQSPANRLDKRISSTLKSELGRLHNVLGQLAPEDSVLGQLAAKWTFIRVPFSFDLAITCAQRGALFECLAIVRMILEQIAWSLDVCLLDDFRTITSRTAHQSIRALKAIHPSGGKFYGWLSAHAHWAYDAHIKAFEAGDGKIGMRLANPLYKAQALGATLVLFAIAQEAYRYLFEVLGETESHAKITVTEVSSLTRELQCLAPQDEDIIFLLAMIEANKSES
jgi:hypothetical protein